MELEMEDRVMDDEENVRVLVDVAGIAVVRSSRDTEEVLLLDSDIGVLVLLDDSCGVSVDVSKELLIALMLVLVSWEDVNMDIDLVVSTAVFDEVLLVVFVLDAVPPEFAGADKGVLEVEDP